MQTIRIEVIVLLCMHLLTCLIGYWIAKGVTLKTARREKAFLRKCLLLNLIINLFVTYILFFVLFKEKNVFGKITEILSLHCAYTDISRLATTVLLHFLLAIPIGYLVVYIVLREVPVNIGGGRLISIVLMILIGIVAVLPGYVLGASGADHLRLQEVCRNTVGEAAADAEETAKYSYVTIRNDGILRVEADRLYLSDDPKNPNEVSVNKIGIKPGNTYQHRMTPKQSLNIHKNGGTTVYLNSKTGKTIDQVLLPALEKEDKYVRNGDAWETVKAEIETVVAVPKFSVESGFYDEPFDLTITAEEGTKVYYTLDCSTPDTDALLYTSPISIYDRSGEENVLLNVPQLAFDYLENPRYVAPVRKCMIVRAVAVDGDGRTSAIATNSYFIGGEQWDDLKEQRILSVVSDPDGLVGPMGIMVTGPEYDEWYQNQFTGNNSEKVDPPVENFNQHGMNWEREADIQIFNDAKLQYQHAAGIRLSGKYNRKIYLKRFSIYARDEYVGNNLFPYTIVNDVHQHSLLVRNGRLHAISQRLCTERDTLTVNFVPAVFFLNGELIYTGQIYEIFDETNIANKYGLMKDNIVLVKNNELPSNAQDGANPHSAILDFFKNHDMQLPENYEAYNQIVDIQSYIDAYCINAYLTNVDITDTKGNTLLFRTVLPEDNSFGDGRWHFGLIDMDLGWSLVGNEPWAVETFKTHCGSQGPRNEFKIFATLKVNAQFCRQFTLTFMDLVNTIFSVENTKNVLDEMQITVERERHFFENRAQYAIEDLAEEFELKGTVESVTLSSNRPGAPIKLNTITPELTGGSWSGVYFTDYPVTATAAEDGFSHWEITYGGKTKMSEAKAIKVPVVEGGIEIHAVFE